MKIKQLKGHRVLINEPDIQRPAIELSPEAMNEFEKEQLSKFNSLTVYAVGDEVTTLKPGDKVQISTGILTMSEVIEIEGSHKLLVREMDINMIWED
jgi:hypothetical protein